MKTYLINLFCSLCYYLTKPFTPKDRINKFIYRFGTTFYVSHSLSTQKMDKMISQMSKATGLKMDWSWVGGRAVCQYVGSHQTLTKHQETINKIHDSFIEEYCNDLDKAFIPRTPNEIKRLTVGFREFNEKYF